MGKPRMIILVRHAQSEGNKNRDIHQFIPDHRVKLTTHGWTQAEEAGRQLRSLLKPDDTLQFFTSPYRRTRETTEGILRTLTADEPTPSPFPRHKITVYEEPRLREQDFGNFQPCSAEMERMWQERADYGHFFYRIPNGESAADAYDRVSGFNESLWRQFGDPDFPSVCVLVTHGMMSRVFLMKWYHWSVEYFEDLRNVNHCEFITMKQNAANGKYILQNELRTWSALRQKAANAGSARETTPTQTRMTPTSAVATNSPTIPTRRWGGCVNGCNHDKVSYPRRVMRKNTADFMGNQPPMPPLPPAQLDGEKDDHAIAAQEADHTPTVREPVPAKPVRKSSKSATISAAPLTPLSPNDASDDASSEESGEAGATGEQESSAPASRSHPHPAPRTAAIMRHLHPRGPTESVVTEGFSDDSDYFPGMHHLHHHHSSPGKSRMRASSKARQQSKERKAARKNAEKGWIDESGMGTGARADTLGDGDELSDAPKVVSPTIMDGGENLPLLREALKGDMIVENSEGERADAAETKANGTKVSPEEVDKMKDADRKSMSEVY